ncbi:AP-5 complex subunit sigma-1-like [Lineus longissimus]|uniref:AP-5 complex subunit sigma-1-like n=1 Tax=Lineus longissimus TaxID=88925 RepID=UPI002B4D2D62
MVYAFIIHVIAGDSARVVYQRYFSQENIAEFRSGCMSRERTLKLNSYELNVPTPNLSPAPSPVDVTGSFRIGTPDHFHGRRSRSPSRGTVQDQETEQPSSKELIASRKQQSQIVSDFVQSEYIFRKAITGRTVEEDLSRLNNEDVLPEFEMGFLRLPAGEPYQTEKLSLWLAAANCCFSFVLEGHENMTIAEIVLKRLIGFLQEHLRVISQPSEAMLKVDRVDLILDKYLPGGQLLFMNHRLSRQLERQIEQVMKS